MTKVDVTNRALVSSRLDTLVVHEPVWTATARQHQNRVRQPVPLRRQVRCIQGKIQRHQREHHQRPGIKPQQQHERRHKIPAPAGNSHTMVPYRVAQPADRGAGGLRDDVVQRNGARREEQLQVLDRQDHELGDDQGGEGSDRHPPGRTRPEQAAEEKAERHEHHQVADPIGSLVRTVENVGRRQEVPENLRWIPIDEIDAQWTDDRAGVQHQGHVDQAKNGQATFVGRRQGIRVHQAVILNVLIRRIASLVRRGVIFVAGPPIDRNCRPRTVAGDGAAVAQARSSGGRVGPSAMRRMAQARQMCTIV